MITALQAWQGAIEVNGTLFNSFEALESSNLALTDTIHIKLYPKGKTFNTESNTAAKQANSSSTITAPEEQSEQEFIITVKSYMTKPGCPEFDFMEKWNNNVPMPLRTMVGYKVKETKGMVYMKLHGDIISKVTDTCMCCGKAITNPVSRYFGMGPKCGRHNYVNPFDTEEELKAAVANYRQELHKITWEGWIIKSAILEQEERR